MRNDEQYESALPLSPPTRNLRIRLSDAADDFELDGRWAELRAAQALNTTALWR